MAKSELDRFKEYNQVSGGPEFVLQAVPKYFDKQLAEFQRLKAAKGSTSKHTRVLSAALFKVQEIGDEARAKVQGATVGTIEKPRVYYRAAQRARIVTGTTR